MSTIIKPVWAGMDLAQIDSRTAVHLAHRQGKSWALDLERHAHNLELARHPLMLHAGFRLITHNDVRFGHVPVYKTNTKQMSDIIGKNILVPHTNVNYADLSGKLTAVAWIRRHKLSELETAVATLLMLDKQIVIVRAFEP